MDEFDNIYISFSGGKDSSVALQMFINEARKKDKLPLGVLFIDLESQYKATIAHVKEMMVNNPNIIPYWIALPFNLRNSVSMYQSQWLCWNPDKKDKWVRPLPKYEGVISDENFFPFYKRGMEFEEFVVEFGNWHCINNKNNKTACVVAIRTDESLNRFRTIRNKYKTPYKGKMWTTQIKPYSNLYNIYPIYDWRTEDIWAAVGKNNYKYNKIYDLMYQHGRSIHECRICQPYGDDQKQGLDLFRWCEPETWAKVVDRVSGANYGNIYCRSFIMGHRRMILPEGHSWKSYANFLMNTIPKFEQKWYQEKFDVFFKWWSNHGFPLEKVPDDNLPKNHSSLRKKEKDGDGYYWPPPSWKRICKCILKNDKICKSLSFGQTKNQYQKYNEYKQIYGF